MNDNPLDNSALGHVRTGVIAQQVRDGEPPETGQTFDRLRTTGYSESNALRMIGAVLLTEIDHMMREQRVFDPDHFRALLHGLEATHCPIVDNVST